MLRLALAAIGALAAIAPPAALAGGNDAALRRALNDSMRSAGSASGAAVYDVSEGRSLYTLRAAKPRILASNVKLFTIGAALDRFGARRRFRTDVLAVRAPDDAGVLRGSLYLRGAGDPAFGSAGFARRAYGRAGATVEGLARRLRAAGVRRITGRVVGDESVFDSLRGGPDSGYATSVWVGPLSGLAFNRGLANERGSSFQRNPPEFAAQALTAALKRAGIRVGRAAVRGTTPARAERLVSVWSLRLARLAAVTGKRSDNFFAEILAKRVHARAGRPGTTAGGAAAAAAFARRQRVGARLVDGSGLARRNTSRPQAIVKFLRAMRRHREFRAFRDALAVAGRDGTLATRMRRTAARGRCRAKTGTLTGVSALSGYCFARSGDVIAFSFLMNGVGSSDRARALQDRMAAALARYG